MKEKQIELPGPDHPISMQRNPARFAPQLTDVWALNMTENSSSPELRGT
jgi:hypothetical protein